MVRSDLQQPCSMRRFQGLDGGSGCGGQRLVGELKKVQCVFEKMEEGKEEEGDDGVMLEAEKDDGLNDCAPSVRYAVRRLIRGVSSSREEVKDCLLGRLFAYGALARSVRLTDESLSDDSSLHIKDFSSVVISLASKKLYLQEPAAAILLDLIAKLPVEALLNHIIESPGLHEWFEGATEAGNRDALLLALNLREKMSVDNQVSKKKQSASFNRHKMITALAQHSTFWILKIIDAGNFPESELQRILDIFKGIVEAYFDSKKSQLKPAFLKEIFNRRPWIADHLFGFLLEKCCCAKSRLRQVEVLDLVIAILKPLTSAKADEEVKVVLKKMLKTHLPNLSDLMKELITNRPDKQAQKAEVRKFWGKVFEILSTVNLSASFLKTLEPVVQNLLEKCSCEESRVRQVEALQLLIAILKPLTSSKADEGVKAVLKKILKTHLSNLNHLMKELITNIPDSQAKKCVKSGVRSSES